jgi:hypothetical protein
MPIDFAETESEPEPPGEAEPPAELLERIVPAPRLRGNDGRETGRGMLMNLPFAGMRLLAFYVLFFNLTKLSNHKQTHF